MDALLSEVPSGDTFEILDVALAATADRSPRT
jgi:hypothetical protein